MSQRKYVFEPRQIRLRGDLEIVFAALDQQRAQPLPLHRHRFVGDRYASRKRGVQRAAELHAPEQLRRERAPQMLAGLGAVDAALVARTFQGVAHRCGEDRTDRVAGTQIDQTVEVGMRNVRPRSVVHQHEFIGTHGIRQRIQTGQHRTGARVGADAGHHRFTVQRLPPLPMMVVCGQHHHHAVDGRMRKQDIQGVIDQRSAGHFQILLRAFAPETGAAPGCRHHRPEPAPDLILGHGVWS